MNIFKVIAVFVLFLSMAVSIFADEKNFEIIQLDSGPVTGYIENGVHKFSGIPYGAPPAGELRWKPPQPPVPWTEVKNCTVPGPSCPQPDRKDTDNFSEDCLYLNVWTAAKNRDERLPVMVWIHGGGFNFGSGSLPEYDGTNLAGKGVVVVTINYRLGPFGFFVHPLLAEESTHHTSGNYGLLDQIAALKWVRKNIALFGGDPDNVTIFGQSAGSRSVTLLMISPLSEGLFHRAIAESGGPVIGSEYLSPNFNGNMENVSRMGEKLAVKFGCDKGENILGAMRAKSAEEILEASDCKTDIFDDEKLFFAPVFDGWVLPKNPVTAYSEGLQHDVPIIVGSTLNEGNIYLGDKTDLSVEKYKSFLKSRFGDNYTEAFNIFPVSGAEDVAPVLDKLLTVAANAQPARFVAQSMEYKKSRAYLYQFTRLPGTSMARKLGVHHGVELAYIFGNMNKSDGYDDTDLWLSGKMMDYWVNFARTGNPNGDGLTDWPAYESNSDINMEFSDTIHTCKELFRKECDFISRLSKEHF